MAQQNDNSPRLTGSEDSGNMDHNDDVSLTHSNPNSSQDSDSNDSNNNSNNNNVNNSVNSNNSNKNNHDTSDEKDLSGNNIDITKIDKDERPLRIYRT